MATNPTSPGPFIWSSTPHPDTPPDNIQQYDYPLSAKANEIKNNADLLHSNIETCFSEKLILCSSNETTQYDTRYQTNYTDDRSTQYATNQNSDKSYRYDSVESTYCGTQRSSRYGYQYSTRFGNNNASRGLVIEWSNYAPYYCASVNGTYHGTVQTNYYTADLESYNSEQYDARRDTYHSIFRSDVKSNVKSVEHLGNRTTVCTILT